MQIILFLPFSATVRDPALALVLLYSVTGTIKEFRASACKIAGSFSRTRHKTIAGFAIQ